MADLFGSIPLGNTRRGTIVVMAVACGVMVGNIYVCQPLLAEMAIAFGVSASTAALVATLTQIGYALGILLVVPLADIADPKTLVGRLLVLAACGLVAAALAPSIGVLLVASLLIAATSIVAQILIPLATTLAAPNYRARIISALSTGAILGILLSRTVSGALGEFAGTWRAPYLLQATLVLGLRFIVPGFLPTRVPQAGRPGYVALLRSLPSLLGHAPLRLSMLLSFFAFAAFSSLWSTLAFHLASPAFHLGPAAAGLFGLWGAPGALMAPVAGRLADRYGSARVNVGSLVAIALCFAVALSWGSTSIAALVVAVNLLDFGVQSGQVANQSRIFGLGDTIRGRLNTLYMVVTFGGAALGALAGGWAWGLAGWRGVGLLGCTLVAAAGVVLARSALQGRQRASVSV